MIYEKQTSAPTKAKPSKLEELRAQLSDESHLSKLGLRILDAVVEHVDARIEQRVRERTPAQTTDTDVGGGITLSQPSTDFFCVCDTPTRRRLRKGGCCSKCQKPIR